MKTTALTETHISLGAKMTEFAGFQMPVYYSSIKEEHKATRNHVAIFDVSHMGEFIVKGKQALDLVERISSNNASKLSVGQAQYSCMPNQHGGIIDDLLVYRLPEDQCSEGEQAFMLVVNASNIEKDWEWVNQNNDFDTRVINISDQTGLLAVQGPDAVKLLRKHSSINLAEIPYYHFIKSDFCGLENVLISATGYTGSGGFELYVSLDKLKTIWDSLFSNPDVPVIPAGLGARDTLRLEMGYCLYGNDIDDTTSPLEAGLGWITKTRKKHDFIAKEKYQSQRSVGVKKKLVGFTARGKRAPRKDYPIIDDQNQQIGKVTSGTYSPSLDIPIGLGYVDIQYAQLGEVINILAGRKSIEAEIVELPFYKRP